MPQNPDPGRPLTLRPEQRIRRSGDFDAVYRDSVRHSAGPLLMYARPNELNHSRIGMAVSRRVGGAAVRNAIRRRLREAFRHAQHDLPPGYDFVVSVRPHEVMKSPDYQRLLLGASVALHEKWIRKQRKAESPAPPGP